MVVSATGWSSALDHEVSRWSLWVASSPDSLCHGCQGQGSSAQNLSWDWKKNEGVRNFLSFSISPSTYGVLSPVQVCGGFSYISLKIDSLVFSSSQHGVISVVMSNELRSEVDASVTLTCLYLSAHIKRSLKSYFIIFKWSWHLFYLLIARVLLVLCGLLVAAGSSITEPLHSC